MSENLIIRHCAPTLAGIKTGSLFNASYDSIEQLDDEIGLFLGYLPEDVKGFIEWGGQN